MWAKDLKWLFVKHTEIVYHLLHLSLLTTLLITYQDCGCAGNFLNLLP